MQTMKSPFYVGKVGASAVAFCTVLACGSSASTSVAASASGGKALSINSNNVAASDPNVTLGLEHIFPLLHGLPHEAMAGFSPACDANAVKDSMMVCGKKMPGNAQATWSVCAAQRGPHGPHDAGPSPDQASHPQHQSTGTFTLTSSASPDASVTCDANTLITVNREAKFSVAVTDANGQILQISGDNKEVGTSVHGSHARDVVVTLNTQRKVTDATGAAVGSLAVNGQVTMHGAQDSNDEFSRVLNGNLVLTHGDGTLDHLGLNGLTFAGHCPWPTAGSAQRTAAAGTVHVLVFASTCGQATLDGSTVTLPHRMGPFHGHGGPHGDHGHRPHDDGQGPPPPFGDSAP